MLPRILEDLEGGLLVGLPARGEHDVRLRHRQAHRVGGGDHRGLGVASVLLGAQLDPAGKSYAPMFFLFAVALISRLTSGYLYGVAAAVTCFSEEDAADMARRGARVLSWSADRYILQQAYRDGMRSLRDVAAATVHKEERR